MSARFAGMALSIIVAVAAGAQPAPSEPRFWSVEWPVTDFERATIDLDEVVDVIQRDQIPAIDNPEMIPVGEEAGIGGREPVMTVEFDGETPRAYPIRYLMFHEIANDVVGGVPIAVTYCPLCNSGVVFDRRVGDRVLSFGVSGKLRKSDMIMYDRQTSSWWQQAIGEGIVGDFAGTELVQVAAWMESWDEFRSRNPDGLVMAAPTRGRYGANPYVSYDGRERPYIQFYAGEDPPHGIPALMRVVRVGDRAWTFARLASEGIIEEAGVTLTWRAGQASALDSSVIAMGRDVGTVRVRNSAGEDVPHDVLFAFAFHAFFPEGIWMLAN